MTIEKFNSLKPSEQRVYIAKDVLKQLKAEKYKPILKNYVRDIHFNGNHKQLQWDLKYEDVKTHFKKIKYCKVCALGSCLMSITRVKNQLSFDEITDHAQHTSSLKLLHGIFTHLQIYLIEACYEGASYYAEETLGEYHHFDVVKKYVNKFRSKKIRLEKIMKNIIRNTGDFFPEHDV